MTDLHYPLRDGTTLTVETGGFTSLGTRTGWIYGCKEGLDALAKLGIVKYEYESYTQCRGYVEEEITDIERVNKLMAEARELAEEQELEALRYRGFTQAMAAGNTYNGSITMTTGSNVTFGPGTLWIGQ